MTEPINASRQYPEPARAGDGSPPSQSSADWLPYNQPVQRGSPLYVRLSKAYSAYGEGLLKSYATKPGSVERHLVNMDICDAISQLDQIKADVDWREP